ncbi:MAG TPA: FecR domain-containing protein [Rhodothermales bacterium]
MRPDRDQIPPELQAAMEETPARTRGLESVWDALASVAPAEPVVPSTDAAWDDLQRRIATGAPVTRAADRPARPAARGRFIAPGVRIGAVAVVLLLVGVGLWWRMPVTQRVAPGLQNIVFLPDGSTVELNSASEIRYARGFAVAPFVAADERRVQLDGEAFFTVTPDAKRPFVVLTGDARIEVVGTRFNVRARDTASGSRTIVTLQEGTVRVRSVGRESGAVVMDSVGASVELRAGETPRPLVAAASLEHVLAWRNNGFAVVDEPVDEILREVQRRFSVSLEVDPALATDPAMTVFYPRGTTAEEIIHDLCLARGWQYREMSRGFAVFPAERPSADSSME